MPLRRLGKSVLLTLAASAMALETFAQSTPPAEALRVTWQRRPYAVVPAIEGYVENGTAFRVSAVRLRIEGFDSGGESVGETSTWTFGSIPAGGRGYFVAPPVPRAATYRITVTAFDRISREEAPGTQSP